MLPRFWIFLCRDWLKLDQQLSWSWWRSLGKSSWSTCGRNCARPSCASMRRRTRCNSPDLIRCSAICLCQGNS